MKNCPFCGEKYTYRCDKCGVIFLCEESAAIINGKEEIETKVTLSENRFYFHYSAKNSNNPSGCTFALYGMISYWFSKAFKKTEKPVIIDVPLSSVEKMVADGKHLSFVIKKKSYKLRFTKQEIVSLIYDKWKMA